MKAYTIKTRNGYSVPFFAPSHDWALKALEIYQDTRELYCIGEWSADTGILAAFSIPELVKKEVVNV